MAISDDGSRLDMDQGHGAGDTLSGFGIKSMRERVEICNGRFDIRTRVGQGTRVRSLSGEKLVFANSDLLQSPIRNFKRMAERRVVFDLHLTYQSPYEKLAAIPGWLAAIVTRQKLVRFDRTHFQRFGEYALRFEVVCYVLDPDFNRYMDIQQAINLGIIQKFQEEGVAFAFPIRTIAFAGDRRDREHGAGMRHVMQDG